jgi:Glycosyl transferase 4-like domain/Glycosyl transferases group 1
MRPGWESGLRGRLYALGRRAVPLAWRRALRRRMNPERLFGIRKPPVELVRLPLDPGPPRPGCADVVFLPVIPWTYRRQRPQQLAEALARRGRRVFYGSLAGAGEPADATGVAPGVTLLPIPAVRREDPADRRLESVVLAGALAGFAAARSQFDLREAVLLVESPFWAPLAAALRERFGWRVVYDCLDAHGAFSTNRPQVLEAAEREIAEAADLVFATSETLRRRMAAWNPHARLLPNACDFGLFAAIPAPDPRPDRLTVGYVGAVDAWFDMALLAELAALRPAWRFEIVGGLEDVAVQVPPLPNLVFAGERPHRETPAYHARFDVEIIPFRLTALTHATDPVKLYEAAAAGRNVVATPMASLEAFARRGLVRLAATADEFAREIAAAATEGEPGTRRQRDFGRENTWDARAQALDGWLTDLGDRDTVSREP